MLGRLDLRPGLDTAEEKSPFPVAEIEGTAWATVMTRPFRL
jgi:hypothetical protein